MGLPWLWSKTTGGERSRRAPRAVVRPPRVAGQVAHETGCHAALPRGWACCFTDSQTGRQRRRGHCKPRFRCSSRSGTRAEIRPPLYVTPVWIELVLGCSASSGGPSFDSRGATHREPLCPRINLDLTRSRHTVAIPDTSLPLGASCLCFIDPLRGIQWGRGPF